MENTGSRVPTLTLRGLCFILEVGYRGLTCDYSRLTAIRKQVNGRVRIVLHGTNGFKDELTQKCIAHGVSKINVNKLVLEDYNEHLTNNAGSMTLTKLMEEGVRHVVKMQEHQMDVAGSSGKATSFTECK